MSALRLSLVLLLALLSRVESPPDDQFACTSSSGKKNSTRVRCTLRHCQYWNYTLQDSLYWHCLTNENTISLDVADTDLTNEGLRSLANSCRNLQSLDISHNELDSLEPLKGMPHLKFVDISYNLKLCNWKRSEHKDIFKDTALVLVVFQGCQHYPLHYRLTESRDMKQHFGFDGVLIYSNTTNDEEISLEVTTTPPIDDSDNITVYLVAVGGGIVVIAVGIIVYYVLRKRRTNVQEVSSTRELESFLLTTLQNRNNDEQEPGTSPENLDLALAQPSSTSSKKEQE